MIARAKLLYVYIVVYVGIVKRYNFQNLLQYMANIVTIVAFVERLAKKVNERTNAQQFKAKTFHPII